YTAPANPFYPIRVKTTIDTQLQEALEETANEQDLYKGAAVLLDIETNELLAAVSRPDIDVSNPYKNEGMQNLALTPLIPGSVFKTVTAAAALEEQLPELDRIFNCNETLYGTADKRELGNLSFEESFAQSCNRTFGDLAKVLQENHSNSLEIYAEKLGLTGEIGWRGSFFHEEEFVPLDIGEGMVFTDSDKRKDKNISAQTGIGQHDVKVSPLAVANMMATIARGGEKKLVKGVQAVQYKNGTTMFEFEDVPADGESISSVTASRLQKLLRSVVQSKEGTGAALQAAPYPIAGKTGTAETGKFIGDKQLYNKWFAGYFPFDQPKYALVVVRTEAFEQGGGVQSFYLEAVNKIYRISGENP
ncbi:MAG TPA: penicillin-binding transpeptidase domain-containing protein, partial [Chondromyces sp.]|nr:penicillin-binding transpeptidase domain-containing protein [Chondromyces sp.]